mgnify:FL=1
MSFFSIEDFIVSGEKALEAGNDYAALSVALMLPSMCSRLAYADNPDYHKADKSPRDRKCYIDWCNENIQCDGFFNHVLGEKYAEVLYQLRCDIVHAGCADIYADGKGLYLSVGDLGTNTDFVKHRIVRVRDLCKFVFDSARFWADRFGANHFKYTRVFDMQNRDDRLLYDRLCDNERADYLEEQFNQENAARNN